MKAPKFSYVRARALSEALQALGNHPNAMPLAGGQSLLPMLNLRLVRPDTLVDISRIPEILAIDETEKGWVIGSGVTHARLEDARERFAASPLIAEVAGGIAYRSVRNLGTIGGSLAHADPAGDWPLLMATLDARIRLRNFGGQTREQSAATFFRGPFTTALQEGELIEAVEIPKGAPGARYGYFKFCRKAGDFPEASAAVVLDPEPGRSRVYMGALNGPPIALPELARAAASAGNAAASQVEAAVAAAVPALDPIDVSMHAAAVSRALQRAVSA